MRIKNRWETENGNRHDETKCQCGFFWIKSLNAGHNFQCARLRLTDYQLGLALGLTYIYSSIK